MEDEKLKETIAKFKGATFTPQQARPVTIVDVMFDTIMICESKLPEAIKLVRDTPVSNNNFGRYLDNLTDLIQTSQSYRNILNNAKVTSEAKAKAKAEAKQVEQPTEEPKKE